ncbi:hypothetical protein CARUB_v10021318mg, partial [Capsella rubella]
KKKKKKKIRIIKKNVTYTSGIEYRPLSSFHRASGVGLNLRKSCLFLDGNNLVYARDLATRHGLLQGSLPPVPNMLSLESDFFLWRNSPNEPPGVFSTSKTWISTHPAGPLVPWFKSVWFKERIPKHAFISWVVIRNRLTTRDRLRGWGMNVPSECLLCTSSAESRLHLFFECAYSHEVWSSFFTHPSLSPPAMFEDIVAWVRSSRSKKLRTICKLIFQAVVYGLWRERNSRLHTSSFKSPAIIIKEIQLVMRAKLAGLDHCQLQIKMNSTAAPTSVLESFLSTWFRYVQR